MAAVAAHHLLQHDRIFMGLFKSVFAAQNMIKKRAENNIFMRFLSFL